MRCTGHSKPRRLRIQLRSSTSAQRWRRQLPGRLASWKMTRLFWWLSPEAAANRTEEIEARRGAGTGGLTATDISIRGASSPSIYGLESTAGSDPGVGFRLSTITTNKTPHLSQPPTQHTRQQSMHSPREAVLKSLRNLVSISITTHPWLCRAGQSRR